VVGELPALALSQPLTSANIEKPPPPASLLRSGSL
jgi:hypothetical protein